MKKRKSTNWAKERLKQKTNPEITDFWADIIEYVKTKDPFKKAKK